ncbi:oligopeptide/dipeptide ABC transporter ATP-binding protein [Streptomonospora salina]|uniref:Oligopeptide/dipeptide ABC transporter ATP-binding protein n=1 Tax=Streptomonospora salina TaxID=104205 RepID=A0A841E190_9ACTN|nr:oligopeptide/dipeptide ABC transporter ATP-binding protein [Streptomonospora salina]
MRGEILQPLLRLRDDCGLAALVVTHDLGPAWNIADRAAVMYLGRVVETGTVEEVLAAPRHPYPRALLSVLPESAAGEEQVLAGEPPDPAHIPAGCRFHLRRRACGGGRRALPDRGPGHARRIRLLRRGRLPLGARRSPEPAE